MFNLDRLGSWRRRNQMKTRRRQASSLILNSLALAFLAACSSAFVAGWVFVPRVAGPSIRRSYQDRPCVYRQAATGDYDAATVAELKAMLQERGLSGTGRKAVLIERLQASDEESPKASKTTTKKAASKEVQSDDDFFEEQGRQPDGKFMCLDGQTRTGDWEKAKREHPDDLTWLTEWVVAARTDQLKEGKLPKVTAK
eukprot:TRINITY_DN7798_c1_g2_i1.p1 TRINITY_DN7798_c1_g2~~TRINITY_DN7798_c1_g2_i1.p1  ORF type:complete len:198 (-),score=37.09 TRINITY_DN7798_c1_g2_i1:108-701(-)